MQILITGKTGEGKTTLASEIQALLESLGFGVEQKDPDVGGLSAVHEARLLELQKRQLTVTVLTKTADSSRGSPASCDPDAVEEALMSKKGPSMLDFLPKSLAEMCEDELTRRVRQSYLVQPRVEQRRRLSYVIKLSVELDRIEKESVFATAFGMSGIEAVMEGNWEEVLWTYEHFSFAHEKKELQDRFCPLWQPYRDIIKAAYDTRPIQGVQKSTH